MSIAESYETLQSLATLAKNVDHSKRYLRLLITEVLPTRSREYVGGLVMSLFGTIRAPPVAEEPRLRVQFCNEWANAGSLADPGDIMILQGFRLIEFPQVVDGFPSEVSSAPLKTEKRFFVVPIPGVSIFRVIQKDPDTGITSEVTVDSHTFDDPRVRVMPVQPADVCASHIRAVNAL